METKKTVKGSKKSSDVKKNRLELIRNRAYELFLKRIKHGNPGDAESDWFQAEKELMN